MEGTIGRIVSSPIVGSYLFNTLGSVVDVISTAYLHNKTGNPDEINTAIRDVMNEKGPLVGGLITEKNRRIGFGLLSIGLLAVDKLITPALFRKDFHLTELVLCGMGLVYFGAAFLNMVSGLGEPSQRKK